MSIRPDRWIREKCMPPTWRITELVQPTNIPGNFGFLMPRPHTRFAYAPEPVTSYQLGTLGVTSCSLTTDEEKANFLPMLSPYEPSLVRENASGKVVSYGTSSYGYDIRCADEFKVFTNVHSTVVDPKNFDPKCFVDIKGPKCIIPPNSFALARTIEYFRIPRNVLTVCLGKSTYARCGIIVNVTPFEPEFEGHVVLEFSNTTPLPAVIYSNEGCAQVLFFESDEACEVSYRDRGGKYQGQTGITTARM